MITMIYEDIFEAIRAFTPNHPFLSLKDSPETTVEIPKPLLFMLGVGEAPCSKFIAASKTYTDSLIQLPMPRTFEEAFIRMGNDIPTHYFRGENCTGRFCIPATFRPVNPPLAEPGFETVIDFLQLLDFTDIARTFPQCIEAERRGLVVNYPALAQHYGVRTDIIDFSSEIFVAAFFATHRYNKTTKEYEVVTEGEGCLRHLFSPAIFPAHYQSIIGLQPFRRPILQYAYGKTMKNGTYLTNGEIHFKHTAEMNQKIHDLYFNKAGENLLFPQELIADVAEEIIKSKKITRVSVNKVSSLPIYKREKIEDFLIKCGYSIVDEPVFSLTEEQRASEMEDMLKSGWWDQQCEIRYRPIYYSDK